MKTLNAALVDILIEEQARRPRLPSYDTPPYWGMPPLTDLGLPEIPPLEPGPTPWAHGILVPIEQVVAREQRLRARLNRRRHEDILAAATLTIWCSVAILAVVVAFSSLIGGR